MSSVFRPSIHSLNTHYQTLPLLPHPPTSLLSSATLPRKCCLPFPPLKFWPKTEISEIPSSDFGWNWNNLQYPAQILTETEKSDFDWNWDIDWEQWGIDSYAWRRKMPPVMEEDPRAREWDRSGNCRLMRSCCIDKLLPWLYISTSSLSASMAPCLAALVLDPPALAAAIISLFLIPH